MNIWSHFRKAQPKPHNQSWPIIVGGFYRSGTSLLRRLLDGHSRIHCGPEVKFWRDFYSDYIDDDLKHLRFFKTARSLGLPEDQLLSIFGNAYVEFLEQATRHHNKKRWADKNPENLLYLRQWNQLLDEK
ncbi:MAG: sulfotransferase, partial [Anaerolineales bacterium]|nr:sulfotransferase [Anaerolineales bacterium]